MTKCCNWYIHLTDEDKKMTLGRILNNIYCLQMASDTIYQESTSEGQTQVKITLYAAQAK